MSSSTSRLLANVLHSWAFWRSQHELHHHNIGRLTADANDVCSAEMLADLGLKWVILGHSERRHIIKEGDEVWSIKIA